jgi:tetratricopeptide (TPR) repeat protein
MKSIVHCLARFMRLLCVLCCMTVATGAVAATDVIDSIDITHGQDQSTIHIRLTIPVSYKSHAPGRSGDLLRIFVEPAPSLGSAGDTLLGEQTIQWSPDAKVPLYDVTYEGAGFASTSITLRFQKDVEFEVPSSGDFRTINVIIKNPEVGKAASGGEPGASAVKDVLQTGLIDRRDSGSTTAVAIRTEATAANTDVPEETAPAVRLYPYVLNLASSATPFLEQDLPDPEIFLDLPDLGEPQTYRLYTTTFVKGGKTWHRLRFGFFSKIQYADIVREELKEYYPGCWVAKASVAERTRSSQSMLAGNLSGSGTEKSAISEAAAVPSAATIPREVAAGSAISPERLTSLVQEASTSMTDKDYRRAVALYTKILQQPDNQYSQDSLEYLGLARERNGQLAQAKMAYRTYLERYPEGEGAERVKQRLAVLLTASKQPRRKHGETPTKSSDQEAPKWDVFGGISQYYRRDENTTNIDSENELTTVSQSALDNNIDVTSRLRSDDYDLQARFTGGYLHDFLDDGVNSDTTVSSMYFDANAKKHGMSMRLGRQSRSTGGVLGRFDGLLLGLPLGSKFSVSAVGGFPVESSSDSFDGTDRYFYGLTVETEGFASGWDANTFVIEQQTDGVTDRRAVGGELRYFDAKRSFFSLVDYDIHYNELNIAQLLGNWTFPSKTTVNMVADYRKSPILTTTNALVGQNVSSIDELQDSFTNSEIQDLASDRTATSKLATLGVSHPMTEKLQVSGDVTAFNLSDTPASGGVLATDGTGTDFVYNLQLVGSNLIKEGDITIFGLRYTDGGDRDIYSLNLNTRYPVLSDLRVNPAFRMDYSNNTDGGSDQITYRPSLRLDYRLKRRLRLEAEIGGEYSDREIVDGTEKSSSYYINMGYRADF